jgi:hypothetical protein
MTHTVETTFTVTKSIKGVDKHVGDIDIKIGYRVLNQGSPARINYNEHDCPAESAEVDVYEVYMLNEPPAGQKPTYVHAFDWLYDWALGWADENADDLAAAARLNVQSIAEDKADADYRERKLG